mgnify:CR=1 FL=1
MLIYPAIDIIEGKAVRLFKGDYARMTVYNENPATVTATLKNCDVSNTTVTATQYDFMATSSYGSGTSTTGNVRLLKDISTDIKGRHVIILEDILDSGNTLAFLKNYFLAKGAASITIVTLLDKPARREKAIYPDLAGFTVPDEFVVGYGLDYAQRYRNVPYIGVLKPEVYEK